jgi:hypothetical protein
MARTATRLKSQQPDLTELIFWIISSERTAVSVAAKPEVPCSQHTRTYVSEMQHL